MTCEEANKKIYLFPELTSKELEEINAHLNTCPSCAALLKQVKQNLALIQDTRDLSFAEPDASKLTHNIMAAIGPASPPFRLQISFPLFRNAMAVLSIVLVFFFLVESAPQDVQISTKANQLTMASGPTLQTQSFSEVLNRINSKKRDNTHSLFECLAACRTENNSDCTSCISTLAQLN